MKRLLFTLFFSISLGFSQNELVIEISNAEYKITQPYVRLDITITNNSKNSLFIIHPRNYFFENHHDKRNQLSFYGLTTAPYSLEINANKECGIKDIDFQRTTKIEDQKKLISQLIEILPGTSKKFEKINVECSDRDFCKKVNYEIQLTYSPSIYILKDEIIKKFDEKDYSTNLEETKELLKILEYEDKTEEEKNKKIEQLVSFIPKIKQINNKKFISNKIIAKSIK